METISIQEKLYSLYFNTGVCFEGISNSLWHIEISGYYGYRVDLGNRGLTRLKDCPPLVLKNIKDITEEDAVNIDFVGGIEHFKVILENYGFDYQFNTFLKHTHIDYLRFKGYALPYMGLSVEQMIHDKWIKLA